MPWAAEFVSSGVGRRGGRKYVFLSSFFFFVGKRGFEWVGFHDLICFQLPGGRESAEPLDSSPAVGGGGGEEVRGRGGLDGLGRAVDKWPVCLAFAVDEVWRRDDDDDASPPPPRPRDVLRSAGPLDLAEWETPVFPDPSPKGGTSR